MDCFGYVAVFIVNAPFVIPAETRFAAFDIIFRKHKATLCIIIAVCDKRVIVRSGAVITFYHFFANKPAVNIVFVVVFYSYLMFIRNVVPILQFIDKLIKLVIFAYFGNADKIGGAACDYRFCGFIAYRFFGIRCFGIKTAVVPLFVSFNFQFLVKFIIFYVSFIVPNFGCGIRIR